MILVAHCPEYYTQYDDWVESIKAIQSLVIDSLNDLNLDPSYGDKYFIYTQYASDNTSLDFPNVPDRYIDTLVSTVKMRSLCYQQFRVLEATTELESHLDKIMIHNQDGSDEESSDESSDESIIEITQSLSESSIDKPITQSSISKYYSNTCSLVNYYFQHDPNLVVDRKTIMMMNYILENGNQNPISCSDVEMHLALLSSNQTIYYQNKMIISNEILSQIASDYRYYTVDRLENDISDYILFEMMPLIVYATEDDEIYAYNHHRGWTLFDKDKLHAFVSKSLRLLFVDHSDVVRYYGSFQNRSRLVADMTIKIRDLCHVPRMNEKYLMGTSNGIYNASNTEFHEFSPRFLVSNSTKIPYQVNVSTESTEQQALLSILTTIFPDSDVLMTVIRWFGYLLEFGNPEKFLVIWHGSTGNNGKSWLQRLLREALGDYYHNVPITLLTSKRASSNVATPELSSMENKLVVFLQEPDTTERIHSGKAKEFTGNDSIYTRGLYKNPKIIDMWAKIVIVANNRIETIGLDAALKRRFLVIPFNSTFVTDTEYNDRLSRGADMTGFKIKRDIDSICKHLAPAFLRLIIEEHRQYKHHGIKISKAIYDHTIDFILANNRTLKFIREYLIIQAGQMVSLMMTYEYFKAWHKQVNPSRSIPSMESFLEELTKESIRTNDQGYIEDYICTYSGTI